MTWSDPELEAALERCRETVDKTLPCKNPVYLLARYEYHKLLVARGLLAASLAEPRPYAKRTADDARRQNKAQDP